MEPVTTTIVAALVAGATAAAKNIATDTIKDTYAGLKRLINDRYEKSTPFVEAVENDPTSAPEQQVLAKQLSQTEASNDDDLKGCAQQLIKAVEELKNEPEACALFDFDVLNVAGNVELDDIHSIGTIFRVNKMTVEKNFTVKGIHQKH